MRYVSKSLVALAVAGVLTMAQSAYAADGYIGVYLQTYNNRCMVMDVYPNSPAADAGIQAGWRLITIDGRVVNSFGDADAARRAAPSGVPITYVFEERSGNLRTFDLTFPSGGGGYGGRAKVVIRRR